MTKLSEKTGGGLIYAPPMMEFDGSTGFYEKSYTSSGNKITVVCRFSRASFTGGGVERLFRLEGPTNDIRAMALLYSSDNADTDRANKILFQVQSSAAANLCLLITPSGYLDGEPHTIFFSFDGDAGAATLYIDGTNADDTGNADRVAPTTGTMESGASSEARLGADATAANPVNGEIGFFGCRDVYLTNWSDFMDSQGNPKALDQFGWTQWGGGTFAPASQDYDGSTGYFTLAAADPDVTAGFTICGRFRWDGGTITSAGGYNRIIAVCEGTSARIKVQAAIVNDQTGDNTAGRLNIYSVNGSGTAICSIFSNTIVSDGTEYTFFASYNPAAGTAVLVLNGASDLNTGAVGHTLTTGTPTSGSGTNRVGANVAGSRLFNGLIGFFGLAGAALTNWGDFMDATGTPKEIDELNWTEWGGQPLFWHKYGAMDDNQGSAGNMTRTGTVTHTPNSQPLFWHPAAKLDENEGSAGAMTENGTITLSDVGSQGLPMIGRRTVGTAIAADIRASKTAWVDGVELVGAAYYPAMMEFDGASYYDKAVTSSGNLVSAALRIQAAPKAGASNIFLHYMGSTNRARLYLSIEASDHANSDWQNRLRFFVQNSAGTTICDLISTAVLADGANHTVMVAFNGTTGAAVFKVDGVDADNTGATSRVAPATGTLDTGVGALHIGSNHGETVIFTGAIGYVGVSDAYLTNWSDFMDTNGNPKALDEFGWTQWGGGTFGPASQDFDGSTGYYSTTATVNVAAGSQATFVCRFKAGAQSAAGNLIQHTTSNIRIRAYLDNVGGKVILYGRDAANTTRFQFSTIDQMDDDVWHTLFFSVDVNAGTVVLKVDGADQDDTGYGSRVLASGQTLDDGATGTVVIGGATNWFDGQMNFWGYSDTYLTNWGDFMDATGVPLEVDELHWTEWGGQPLFWHKYCDMENNVGSFGAMVKNGTVTHTPNSQPLFWHEAGKMDEQLGHAGVMTENGTIRLGKGGNT